MKATKILHRVIAAALMIAALATGQKAWASNFKVENTNNVFTITRTSNTTITETVNYRTVSLSALAGVHFTAQSDTLLFDADHNTRTVAITEASSISDVRYRYQDGTTRTYRFEVLDVNGFQLVYKDRDITYSSNYQHTGTYVNRSVTDLVYFTNSGSIASGSGNKYLDVAHSGSNGTYIQVTDGGYKQNVHTVSTASLFNNNTSLRSYLNTLEYKMYATVYFTQKEEQDGYQYIQILADNSSTYDGDDSNGAVSTPSTSLYKSCFILSYNPSGSVMSDDHYQFFPHRYDYIDKATETSNGISHYEFDYDNSHLYQQAFKSSTYRAGTSGSLVLSPTVNDLNIRFDAAGSGGDTWDFKNLKVRLALVDAKAPYVLAEPQVSAGPYVRGNTFYISVPFSEIVTVSESVLTLSTTWGSATYLAGSGTNVLTFRGFIAASTSTNTTLSINGFDNSSNPATIQDLAGNPFSGTITKDFNVASTHVLMLKDWNTKFSGFDSEYVLSNNAIEPHPTVKLFKGTSATGTSLTEGTHYTLSWSNNTAAGNGIVTATGTGSVTNVGSFTGSVSTTFPIRWATYTVHFDANGGEGTTMSDMSFTYDEAQQLTANTFTRTGYTFGGWNTEADGTGTAYTDGQSVQNLTAEDGATVTLYAQWTAIPWTGTGSSDDPYIIQYPSQLDLLATNVNNGTGYSGKYFELANDITYPHTTAWDDDTSQEDNFTAIGISSIFEGTFDGKGHTVSGIRIYKPTAQFLGLFGYLYRGTVKNVTLADARITGGSYIGGIVGYFYYGLIENCLVLNTAITGEASIGAVVGYKYDGTLRHDFYRNCIVKKGSMTYTTDIGLGAPQNDFTGEVASVHKLTLGTGITASGESVVIGDTTYYAHKTTVTFTYGGTPSTGQTFDGFSVQDANSNDLTVTENEGTYTFEMPASDASISAILTDHWDITHGANGSEGHPYVISTTAGLDLLATNVNNGTGYSGKYFELANDITYPHTTAWDDDTSQEDNFTAIGISSSSFLGTFDGKGHTVIGIRLYKPANRFQGLFGYLDGTVKNVTLADARITGEDYTGGIAGENWGTIENCHAAATVTIYAAKSSTYYHGGITGNVGSYQKVRGCTSAARVTMADGISNCNSYGGIAGYSSGTIENCLALGATVNANNNYGAIVGYNSSNGTLTANYYHDCTMNGTANATGVGVGYDYNGTHAPHDRDGARSAYSVSAAAGSSLAPSGTATTAYPYNGIQAFDNNLYYNSVVYVPAYDSNVTVTLTLGCAVPEGYALDGYTATSGTLTLVEGSTYSLTLADADVVISPVLTDHWGIANGADGSAEHPYLISTTAGLDLLATRVNNGARYNGMYFELANDITYPHTTAWDDDTSQENNFTTISNNSSAKRFEGTFDGKGHTVSGIRIYKPANPYQGLFGYIMGTVKNVALADARITGANYTGGIAGRNNGTIENCHAAATVTIYAAQSSTYYHGGITGDVGHYKTVRGCTSAARVTKADGISGCYDFGGIAGNNQGIIENCLALGATVNANSRYGAIVGIKNSDYLTSNYYHNCTVGGTANATGVGTGNDGDRNGARSAYSVSAAAGSSLAPSGTATTAYPYNGIQVFGPNLYYNNVVYVPAYDSNVTVTLTLGCAVPEGYALDGYTATSGTLTLVEEGSTYLLTRADADVVISPVLTPSVASTGDVNGDGSVTIADVPALVALILSGSPYNPVADVNGDNSVSLADVTALVNRIKSEE